MLEATKIAPGTEIALPQCLLREAALRALQLGSLAFFERFQILPYW